MGVFIGWCWTDSCCIWLLTRGLITVAWQGHYLWAAAMQSHNTVSSNNCSNWVTNNDLSCSASGKSCNLLRTSVRTWPLLTYVMNKCGDYVVQEWSEAKLSAQNNRTLQEHCRLLLFFSLAHLCHSCQTPIVWVYSSFASHFSSLHMSWSQQPPPPQPPLPPTFSRVLQARQLWKQCAICAAGRESGSLPHLPILTRFSRDIRENKRCDIPAFHCSKLRRDLWCEISLWIKGEWRTVWMTSLHVKWGDTKLHVLLPSLTYVIGNPPLTQLMQKEPRLIPQLPRSLSTVSFFPFISTKSQILTSTQLYKQMQTIYSSDTDVLISFRAKVNALSSIVREENN